MATDILTGKRSLSLSIESGLAADAAFALRYDVFNQELGEGLPESRATARDVDAYDEFCEHLCVRDMEKDCVVGTYRLLTRERAAGGPGFYSETEFKLDAIYEMEAEPAEIGRSCVHREYRDGSVITLLWAGLAGFMKARDIQYLMGCGSIHSTDPLQISRTYAYVRAQGGLDSEIQVEPLGHLRLTGFQPNLAIEDKGELRRAVPPLIKGYLRAGARVCGHPAMDPVFKTTDFFLFFNRSEVEARYGKHFLERGSDV